MTKREVKESLVSALRDQGIDYRDKGDTVYFNDVAVLFDTEYITIIHDPVSIHYPLSVLSYITVMGGALWVSTISDYNFTVIRF